MEREAEAAESLIEAASMFIRDVQKGEPSAYSRAALIEAIESASLAIVGNGITSTSMHDDFTAGSLIERSAVTGETATVTVDGPAMWTVEGLKRALVRESSTLYRGLRWTEYRGTTDEGQAWSVRLEE